MKYRYGQGLVWNYEGARMDLIGLTGGTGSGKTAAGKRLSERGLPVIDADQVGHDVIAPGGAAEAGVIAAFGEEIIADGRIDRERLAARVFNDTEALKRLNALVHPAIFAEIGQRCTHYAETGAPAVIIDAALLGDSGELEPWLGGLILVTALVEVRVQRLVSLRGMREDDARRRIAAQVDPERKRAFATWVVDNSGTLEQLYEQVDGIADAIEAGT